MTRQMKRILVPIDGSKSSIKGLEEALYLARASGAKVTALHVIPGTSPIPITDTIDEYRKQMKKRAREFFDLARKTASRHNASIDEKVIFGIPQYDIADYGSSKKFDMIVVGARGLGAIKSMFLGSVSNATLHRSKVPVLIVK